MSLDAGTTLGKYEILSLLGAGGMGAVYRARDAELGRNVAIKLLLDEVSSDADRLARFEREARALAAVHHPNVATLFGFETAGETRFLVMELVDGETLSERISRGSVRLSEAIDLALQIARGLEAAHARGVVHRDLKPDNIKLTPAGELKILDFGLAKAASGVKPGNEQTLAAEATQPGTLLGTVAYMSPEQAAGDPVDQRSDIWSFGCVLYELVTGRRAFAGSSSLATMTAVVSQEPDWGRLPPSTPGLLRQLLLWCLQKAPSERLQHIGDGRSLLTQLRDQGPLAESARGGDRRPGLPRSLVLPGAAALLLLGAGLGWLATLSDPPSASVPTPRDWSVRPVTATGDAWNVALSPDGGMVAYLTSEGLTTQDISGGDPNLILADDSWSLGFTARRLGRPQGEHRWLHDGTGVAFTTPIDDRTLVVSAVPRMGGPIQPRLTVEFDSGEVAASLQSLRDNGFLLARVLEDLEASPWIRWIENGVEHGIDLPEEIDDLWDAVASSQGDWVAYVGERPDRSTVIATVARSGSHHNVIVEGRSELSKWQEMSTSRQWSSNRILRWPPGDRIYYREMSSRGLDLYAVAIDPQTGKAAGEPELVYSGLPPAASFDVALDGRRIAYSGGIIKTQIRVFRFDRRRSGPALEGWQLTSGTARHMAPRISPDGGRVAYVRKTRASENIYIAPLRGGEAEQLYTLYDWTRLVDLKWGPTGDELFVFAETKSGSQLLRISLAESRVTEIATRPLRGTWFALSPDGARIGYGIRSDASYLVQELATGQETEVLADQPGEKIQAFFSPDGGSHLLVNNVGQHVSGLWTVAIEGGEARRVTAEVFGNTYPLAWSDDGTVHILGERGTLSELDVDRGVLREIGRIPVPPIWDGWASVHVTADEIYLACAVDEPRESDVWILDRGR